jgi:hypothetical protein
VVQFANSACNSTEQGKQGLCYTNNECKDFKGRPAGTCALGFGVCCICKLSVVAHFTYLPTYLPNTIFQFYAYL